MSLQEMRMLKVGDLVFLKSDKRPRRVLFKVLAVSEVYESVKLGSDKGAFCMWRSYLDVRKVSFYQPSLFRIWG